MNPHQCYKSARCHNYQPYHEVLCLSYMFVPRPKNFRSLTSKVSYLLVSVVTSAGIPILSSRLQCLANTHFFDVIINALFVLEAAQQVSSFHELFSFDTCRLVVFLLDVKSMLCRWPRSLFWARCCHSGACDGNIKSRDIERSWKKYFDSMAFLAAMPMQTFSP